MSMERPEPIMATACEHCGEPFNTSAVHPSRYCSIACEERRGPLPEDDPRNPNFPMWLQGHPEGLVGRSVLAEGYKRTCYSPEWHRDPEDYSRNSIKELDEANEILIVRDDVFLGKVIDYDRGSFILQREDMETGEVHTFEVDDTLLLYQVKADRWWVDG